MLLFWIIFMGFEVWAFKFTINNGKREENIYMEIVITVQKKKTVLRWTTYPLKEDKLHTYWCQKNNLSISITNLVATLIVRGRHKKEAEWFSLEFSDHFCSSYDV